ncbi:MAG: hypothetical protein LBV41_09065 [Cytophagaceae bacterium]|nr:hypothetical protein [Cytophagaceae bacterium]
MRNITVFWSLFCLIAFTQCKNDVDLLSEQSEFADTKSAELGSSAEPADEMILGRKLENPYSVENMTKAYDGLKKTARSRSIDQNIVIKTTHLYIRFQPRDTAEYNYLIDRSGLSLFTYPLDYETVQEGNCYKRADANDGELPWLYTSVPVESADEIAVKYDILEYCHIPDEAVAEAQHRSTAHTETLALLELESLRLTGNITRAEYDEAITLTRGKKKNPSGYIKVHNTSTGILEGVKRVKVRVHNFVKWCEAYTDENGYYQMSKSYRSNVHYAVIYENHTGFKVWGNFAFLAPANHNMNWHSPSGYSTNLYTNSRAWLWSTVNNAAYIYREKMCPAFGITKPASDLRLWTTRGLGSSLGSGSAPMAKRLSLEAAVLTKFLSKFSVFANVGYIVCVMPDVFILKDFKGTKECYSTVFHEMAHASHFAKVGKEYWLNYIWGIINNGGYGNSANGTKAGYIGVGEMWGYYFGYKCMNNAHALGFTQFNSVGLEGTNYWFKLQIMKDLDEKCGLSPKQIYDCLSSDVTNHTQFKNKLISKYASNNTALQRKINAAFSYINL